MRRVYSTPKQTRSSAVAVIADRTACVIFVFNAIHRDDSVLKPVHTGECRRFRWQCGQGFSLWIKVLVYNTGAVISAKRGTQPGVHKLANYTTGAWLHV